MNKALILFRVQMLDFFGINCLVHSKNKNERNNSLFSIFTLCILVVAGFIYSTANAESLISLNLASVIAISSLLICSLVIVFFTILRSSGILFGFKDYDMIMSMPVKSWQIILSRFLSTYVTNIIIVLALMLSPICIYGNVTNASISVWIILFISILLAPLIPMVIGMVVGALVTGIAVHFRHKNLVLTGLIAFALLAYVSYMAIVKVGATPETTSLESLIITNIYRTYPPSLLFSNAIINDDWLSFIAFFIISIGCAAIFIIILSKFYTKINSLFFTSRDKNNYKIGKMKSASPFFALYKKELRRFFTTPTYIVNSGVGVILVLIFSIAYIFFDVGSLYIPFTKGNITENDLITMFLTLLISVFFCVTSPTTSSISLEGKSRWLMCSAPVEASVVFKSKIATSLTVMLPVLWVSCALIAININANLLETLVLFANPTACAIFTSVLGLSLNLKFPKYDWANEHQVIKNSTAVLLTMVIGLALFIALSYISIWLSFISFVGILFMALIYAIAALILYLLISKKKLYM